MTRAIVFGGKQYTLFSTTLSEECIRGGSASDLARWERIAWGDVRLAQNKGYTAAVRDIENVLALIAAQRTRQCSEAALAHGLIVG